MHGAWQGEEGVSEVISYVVTFGIMASVIISSLLAFAVLQDRSLVQQAKVQAHSAADQVARATVEVALLREQGATQASVKVGLPEQIAGRSYTVAFDIANGQVVVLVPGYGVEERAPLAGVEVPPATNGWILCQTAYNGGPMNVMLFPDPLVDPDAAGSCGPGTSATPAIFFSEALP